MVAISASMPVVPKSEKVSNDPKQSSRWRSTGWTPLAYPSSALVESGASPGMEKVPIGDTCHANHVFPLHQDVLRACLRELLILDGTIDGHTLTLIDGGATLRPNPDVDSPVERQNSQKGPRYMTHLQPSHWVRAEECCAVKREGRNEPSPSKNRFKRKLPQGTNTLSRNNNNNNKKARTVSKPAEEPEHKDNTHEPAVQPGSDGDEGASHSYMTLSCSERLTDRILMRAQRAHLDNAPVDHLAMVAATEEESSSSLRQTKPPRKVSDADSEQSADDHSAVGDEIDAVFDISCYVDFPKSKKAGAIRFLRTELPSLLHVSIVTEALLRERAFEMTKNVLTTFDEDSLRLFLGYKSCSLKRDRIVRLLSDYLFDVSHAMFAWTQTEGEIVGTKAATISSVGYFDRLDAMVRDALFDQRALKKIGGWDDASILRHAVSISRCTSRNESWETFAKSVAGRRLLSHHRSGKAFVVGQKRRGQRMKHRAATTTAQVSSPPSPAKICSPRDVKKSDESECKIQLQDSPQSGFRDLPDVLRVGLNKKPGDTWGILLSREGDLCVVDRAPKLASLGETNPAIQRGDMILSVENERGEHAGPPNSFTGNPRSAWFRDVVRLFKTSNQLRLAIRRVGP